MIAKKILTLLDNNKRIQIDCAKQSQHHCLAKHQAKLEAIISRKEKIQLILPAFPAKSSNQDKTFSALPDMGERLALEFLNDFCEQIRSFYPPGASIIICSDGRVFSDLVLVKDQDVTAYFQAMQDIIDENKLLNISLYSLDNFYQNTSYVNMREQLILDYCESEFVIKNRIKDDEQALQLFNGIHRFIYEDNLFHFPQLSKNKIREFSKAISYQVIQRSNAWSALLEQVFPTAFRLSIHPQFCGSDKIGIMLLKADNVWATPWHRVVLFDGDNALLIRKKDAEALGALPVFIQNKFSHYSLRAS